MNLPLRTPQVMLPMTLGVVIDVADPLDQARVKVRLHAFAGVDGQEGEVWARTAVPVAGDGYGTLFVPDVDDQVVVAFLNGDPRDPVVLGALYHGQAQPADRAVEGGGVKRWTITGHRGTRIAIDESGSPTITLETPGGAKVELTDDGQTINATNGMSTVKIAGANVSVTGAAEVKVDAAQVKITAGMVTVDAAMSKFSGVVQSDVLITNTVISTTYTPGAGNVW